MQDMFKNLENIDRIENTILRDLYYGHIVPFRRKATQLDERKNLNGKIESERRYFQGKILTEDRERFQMFLNNYDDLLPYAELDAFTYGFRLAARLMTDVFTNPVDTAIQQEQKPDS